MCGVVYQVAKTTLKRVDDVDVGRFNNGDVYLVMHAAYGIAADSSSAKELTRTLFYWVGSKASMDKGTVACIKAVELRRALTGPCQIRREDEGQESPEFLVLFDEVTVAEDESGARVLSKVVFRARAQGLYVRRRQETLACSSCVCERDRTSICSSASRVFQVFPLQFLTNVAYTKGVQESMLLSFFYRGWGKTWCFERGDSVASLTVFPSYTLTKAEVFVMVMVLHIYFPTNGLVPFTRQIPTSVFSS